MSNTKAKFNVGISRSNRDYVSLDIEDSTSGDKVLRIKMSLEQYALIVTGLHGVEVNGEFNTKAAIGKQRETKQVSCERVWDKDMQRQLVIQDFENSYEEVGWEIQSDGLSTKQRADRHIYVIKRYVDHKEG